MTTSSISEANDTIYVSFVSDSILQNNLTLKLKIKHYPSYH